MNIILLGAPGAGKGTQCKKIVKEFDLEHLSSGDILRQERSEGTELGKEAQKYMDAGELVPDHLIVEMMAGAIKKVSDKGYVLDGFPRTVNQAKELDKALEEMGQNIDLVINLEIDDETVMERMTGRRSCPECGAVYHIKNVPPKVDEICDNCGAKLVQRDDDKPDVVRKRQKTYHEQTEPVAYYYKESKDLLEIDATRDGDEVISIIFDKIRELQSV